MQHNIDKLNQLIGAYESELAQLVIVTEPFPNKTMRWKRDRCHERLNEILIELRSISHDMGKDWQGHCLRLEREKILEGGF